jgi:hypothetical protein
VTQGSPHGPGGTLQSHGYFPSGRRTSQGAELFDGRVSRPPNHAQAGTGRNETLVQVVRQQIDCFIHPVAEDAEPERDGSSQAASSRHAPERGGAVGG